MPPTGGWDPDPPVDGRYGGGRHDYRDTGAPRRAPVLRYAGEQPGIDPPRPLWRRRGKRRRAMPLWQELPLLLIVAFCLAVLIRTFLLQAFLIPSGSMETTLNIGDRVLVNKIVYDVRDPTRGEVVVFRGPDNWAPENQASQGGNLLSRVGHTIGDLVGISKPSEKDFIKRVIGLPGDVVACCDPNGNVTVNGQPLDEHEYLPDERNSPLDRAPIPGQCGSRAFAPVTVPPGQLFVMGDHRLVSQDSRCQGPIPISNVIGRAFVIVWPNSRWNGLPVPAQLQKVPKKTALAPQHPVRLPAGGDLPAVLVLLPLGIPFGTPAGSRRRGRWVSSRITE